MFVGALNTVLGYVVVFVAYNIIHLSYWAASATAYIGLLPVNYILHKRITFKKHNKTTLRESIAYTANILICYLLAYKVSHLVICYALRNFLRIETIKIIENVALIVGNILYALLNFLGQKMIVFKKKELSELSKAPNTSSKQAYNH
ncbi:MAG: GtrA family protein [Synergistaceae bacterium]|nr:GtrA family protein [Candidatus Equadaptatus faecalis]